MGASCTKTHNKSFALPMQLAQPVQPGGKILRTNFDSPSTKRKSATPSVQPQAAKKLESEATPRHSRNARKLLPSGIFKDLPIAPMPVSQGTNNHSPQNPEAASLRAFERLSQPAQAKSPANLSDWQQASESKDPLLTPTPKGDEQSTIKIFRDVPGPGTSTNKHSVNHIGTTTTLNKKQKEDFYPLKNIGADKLSSQVSIFVTKNENLSIGQQILEYYNSKSPRSPLDATLQPKFSHSASQQSIMAGSNHPSKRQPVQAPEIIVVIPPEIKPKKPIVRHLRRFLVKAADTRGGLPQTVSSNDTRKPFRVSRIKGDFVNRSGQAREAQAAKQSNTPVSKESRYHIRVNGPSAPAIGENPNPHQVKHINLDCSPCMQVVSDKSIGSSSRDAPLIKKSGRLSLCETFQNEISFRELKGTSLRQLREELTVPAEAQKDRQQTKRTGVSNTQTEINCRSEPKFRRMNLQPCDPEDDSFFTEQSFVYESYSTENDPLAYLQRMS